MSEKSDKLIYTLTKKKTIFLFAYFGLFLLTGIITLVIIMIRNQYQENIIPNTIMASFSSCGALCSMQYIKRLYKACLQGRIKESQKTKGNEFKELGNFVYFLLRPLFALTFVLILIFSLRSGLIVLAGTNIDIINEKFLYICALASACIGYSVGNVLDRFEQFSTKKVNRTFEKLIATTEEKDIE